MATFVQELHAQLNSKGGARAPKTTRATFEKDGVAYQQDCWSKLYAPASEFVSGKNYTKASLRRWTEVGTLASKLDREFRRELIANGKLTAELKEKHEFIEAILEGRNHNPDVYADLKESEGFLTYEELMS